MFFLFILAAFLILFLGLGAVVQFRDHKAHRQARESEEMWRTDVREQARDVRASHALHNIYNPDMSWTDWGRRNRREK